MKRNKRWTSTATLATSMKQAGALRMSAVALLLAVAMPGAVLHSHAQQADFERFKQQNKAQFEKFSEQREAEFRAFVKRWQDAEKNYVEQLKERWNDGMVSGKTKWVSYSDDQSQRTIIDYENDTVTVEFLASETAGKSEAAVRAEAEQVLAKATGTSLAEAVAQDPIHVNAGVNLAQLKNSQQMQQSSLLGGVSAAEVTQQPAQVKRQGKTTSVTIQLPTKVSSERAQRMFPIAEKYAMQRGLPVELVMAIMHTESSFNPLARSPIPAFGLMQIVPTSAGRDVTEFLTGQQRVLSAEYLYDPEQNVQAGTVYLHLLGNRYFKQVEDPVSRMYLAIAAYNTGPGNVSLAMAQTKSLSDAAQRANGMSAAAVYEHLMQHLPATETKNYLRKVVQRQQFYKEELQS
ncbi:MULTISPECIES: transglycosylase SLT domain-containing protein [Pseudidiomarina]|uniref:Membrane-bound lytic murein transglycosylase C n=2 Tax=Pseudidiomarina TaxID=2800384 RepID=A0A368URL1_9GAMM|nr:MULTISPECIES: transglycosylase SLT domain-containing protein [Pseudidiomarina]PWW12201.1 membrane-bound lytic murein transglycosylase C [Pseudidiomarina maritima]RBP89858.1 membrane-bound lytic murein transglycosylase C [Pseudidiomarina tainanensis]RCW31422.1 membrane-bound lytic murein transglycosylase C [Pseudidiomarina tainanensis]